MSKKQSNPFDIFTTSEQTITVDALGGAEVTIKTALTVAEQLKVDELLYANMGTTEDGRPFFNPADHAKAQVQAVSFLLIEPKMSVQQLNKLAGAEKAISEIYGKYLENKSDKKVGN